MLLLLIVLGTYAQKPDNCPKWVPNLIEGNSITEYRKAQNAKLKQSLMLAEDMIKSNPHFLATPEARLRNMIIIDENQALIHAVAYSKKGWNTKGCGLIPQADRIVAGRAYFKIMFNWIGLGATATEIAYTTESGIEVFYEPVPAGTIAGFPYYNSVYGTNLFILTYNNKVPWVPVTIGEYLDWEEERIVKKMREHDYNKAHTQKLNIDDAKVQRLYAELKKTNPQSAEEYLKSMEKLKASQGQLNAQVDEQNRRAEEVLQKDLEELKTFRAGFSPAGLREQASLCTASGDNRKYGLCLQNDPSSYKRNLVKLAPEYIFTPGNKKIRVISISYLRNSPEPGWQDHLQKTIETLNYKALMDLMK